MTSVSTPELVYDPDPAVWLVGPTDERPPGVWLPGAVDVMCRDFEIDDEDGTAFVTRVLEAFSGEGDPVLSERLLRWRHPMDDPFPVELGMVARHDWSDDELDQYVGCVDLPVVEPTMVETVEGGRGPRIRRGLAYSLQDDILVVSVRYVIEASSASLVALLHTASDVPAQIVEALDDLDDLARVVDVRGEVG